MLFVGASLAARFGIVASHEKRVPKVTDNRVFAPRDSKLDTGNPVIAPRATLCASLTLRADLRSLLRCATFLQRPV